MSNCRPLVQIAPMLKITNTHFRHFMRLITQQSELWTEMVTASMLLYLEDVAKCLQYEPKVEEPIVCQIGGSDPETMAQAASIACRFGYNRININVGCPSPRVAGEGCFGAALFKTPELVRDILVSISRQIPNDVELSLKIRTGVDDMDSLDHLRSFINKTVNFPNSPCSRVIIHARKAWLKGLNPHQNRQVPPLNYEYVYKMVDEFPSLQISLNGGIKTIEQVSEHVFGKEATDFDDLGRSNELQMASLHGVMIGRAAYNDPCMLASVDSKIYKKLCREVTRRTLIEQYSDYIEEAPSIARNFKQEAVLLLKPVQNILHACQGNFFFRQSLQKCFHENHQRSTLSEALATIIDAYDQNYPHILDLPLCIPTE